MFFCFKFQVIGLYIFLEMTPDERRSYQALRELPTEAHQNSDDWIMLDDILDGSRRLEVSHEGGELSALADLTDEWRKSYVIHVYSRNCYRLTLSSRLCRVDYRTRQDRTERRTQAFEKQMEAITEAYLDWSLKYADRDDPVPDPPSPADSGVCSIRVVDLFSESLQALICPVLMWFCSCLW